MATKTRTSRRTFGNLRKLPSGRWQARYTGPDGRTHRAPVTFTTKGDAEAWLAAAQAAIHRAKTYGEDWTPPETQQATQDRLEATGGGRGQTFATYADEWLERRTRGNGKDALRPRTAALYRSLLRTHLLPTFGDEPLTAITRKDVRTWWDQLDTGPTAKANAYGLLRTIMGDAVDREVLDANPVQVKRAGTKRRKRPLRVLEPAELRTIVEHLPERYRAMVLLGAWCALRFGELAALRRRDLDLDRLEVHVRRAVSRVDGRDVVGPPKADSIRTVPIPPRSDLVDALRHHLETHAQPGKDGLLFPPARPTAAHRQKDKDGRDKQVSAYLAGSTFHRVWKPAAAAAGRPDVRVHDMRHFGAIQAARVGATLGELQQRLGHSTAQAALVYQSAVSGRQVDLARLMAQLED